MPTFLVQAQGKQFTISSILKNLWELEDLGQMQVKWSKPREGWCFSREPGKVGGGGLIRDYRGAWLKGFNWGIGFTKAEFWALRDGLLLAVQMGILYLEVELDARSVVNIV